MVDTYEKACAIELLDELVRDGMAKEVKKTKAKNCVLARDGKMFIATSVGVLRIR
jgi:hypothetical protein